MDSICLHRESLVYFFFLSPFFFFLFSFFLTLICIFFFSFVFNYRSQTTSEPKEILPPLSTLSILLHPTPQHNLSEIQRESTESMNNHHTPIMPHHTNNTPVAHDKYNNVGEDPKQQQQQPLRANSPLFPASHPHISGQLNSPDHRPPQNNGVHSTQRAIAPDMRLPSIKHFENITNIPQSSSSVKQHQAYPSQSQPANMQHIQSQPPVYNTSKSVSNGIRNSPPIQYSNTYNHQDLLSQPSHLTQNSSMWTRPQTIPHSPSQQSLSPVISDTSTQKAPVYQQTLEKQQPVRFVTNSYSQDYQNGGSFTKDNTESNINTQIADKALSDMQKVN
jgi:hypothetical protein